MSTSNDESWPEEQIKEIDWSRFTPVLEPPEKLPAEVVQDIDWAPLTIEREEVWEEHVLNEDRAEIDWSLLTQKTAEVPPS